MKLIILHLVVVLLLYGSITQVKCSTGAGETIFNFLNDFSGESKGKKVENANLDKNFRFMSAKDEGDKAAEATGEAAKEATKEDQKNPNVVDLNDPNTQLEEWMTIASPTFANKLKYPQLLTPDGSQALIDLSNYERVNSNFEEAAKEGAPTTNAFWFKARGGYIYYSSTKEDINVLDAIYAKEVKNIQDTHLISNNAASCILVKDYENNKWTICAPRVESKMKWMCSLQKFLNQNLDFKCTPAELRKAKVLLPSTPNMPAIEEEKVIQPVIVIPMASKSCNEKWGYENKGLDWECTCKEGAEQSPIDLPSKDDAILSPLKPMFQYDMVSSNANESTLDGLVTAGDAIKIRYDKEAIRIYHPNLGKIVTLDGGVYIGEEISFHTPSEHKINGVRYDMEMQVVHYGRSKGDIAKQVVLSFLFKKTPGVYNKFIDKLDFFTLPNPTDTYRDLEQDLFLPFIFYNSDEDSIASMQPFSFFTYEGSLTQPPCTERTTHYVAADPIPLSNTVITLFKEALKKPDMENPNDPTHIVLNDDGNIENYRDTQPLNGRTVYIFDHRRYGCVDYKPKKKKIEPSGHYEKIIKDAIQYVFVNGHNPSNIPGSYVVSEKEAKGGN